jgi:hypothetical protein
VNCHVHGMHACARVAASTTYAAEVALIQKTICSNRGLSGLCHSCQMPETGLLGERPAAS